jgi:hypothetical protein
MYFTGKDRIDYFVVEGSPPSPSSSLTSRRALVLRLLALPRSQGERNLVDGLEGDIS